NTGPASAEASGTPTSSTDTSPPTVPSNLAASGVTQGSVTLTWTGSSDPQSGVKQYNVFRDGSPAGTATATSFTDTGLSPATSYAYAVSAVNNAGLESAQSAALSVTTLAVSTAVTITNPAGGAQVGTPTTFDGTFTTDGSTGPAQGAPLADAFPPALAAWAKDPFVNAVLHSPEWQSFTDSMAGTPGFLTAFPSPEDGGVVIVELSGARPSDAPLFSPSGWRLVYVEDLEPKPILTLAQSEPTADHVFTVDQVAQMIADGTVLNGAPTTPTPGVQQGLGPGTGIQMALFDTVAPAGIKSFICTANFLFEDPASGTYYLATAGHCLQDTNSVDATAATKARWVRLCFRNCVNNGGVTTLGDYVLLEPDSAYPGYTPVKWAHQNGIGDDAGLIEIPPSLNGLLRPWLWFWGGPRGTADFAANDVLVHWGHGVATGTSFATQGRAAIVSSVSPIVNANAPRGFAAYGALYGGDSGSDASKAAPRTDKVAVGDKASGILTHSIALAGEGLVVNFFGTQMSRALQMWTAGAGFTPQLVTEDAVIRTPGAPPATTLGASITRPVEDTAIDPLATPAVNVQGTASFPPGSAPGTGSATYYLHRSSPGGCAATMERLWMDPTPSPVRESGTGCGSVRDPAGPVVEQAVNITAQVFPTAPPSRTTSAIVLDPTRAVQAVVWLNASLNRSTNAAAPPGYVVVPGASVVNDLEAYATYEVGGFVKEIGRQRLFPGPMVTDQPTPVTFSFLPQVSQIPANADIRLTFVVHESVTHLSTFYGGSTLSRLELPLGTVPAASVQVSVDDPTFQPASLLTVTGTTSWTAPWSTTSAANGAHTLYARALQASGSASAAPVHVTVTQAAGPTASFTSSVAGLTATFTDTSVAGSAPITSWAWSFGDSATSNAQGPSHTYASSGTYTASLTVTDQNGQSSTASAPVTVSNAATWLVQTRLLDPQGQEALPWTTVASPGGNAAGSWSQIWAPSPDPTPGTYTLQARLLRNGNSVASDAHTFDVISTNQAPTANAGNDQTVDEGTPVSLAGSASDANGDAMTFAWTQVAGPAVTLSGAGTLTPGFTPPDRNADTDYTLRLTATDSHGASGSDDVVVHALDLSRIRIATVNGAPVPVTSALADTAHVAGTSSLQGGAASGNLAPTAVIGGVTISGLDITASGAGSFDPDCSIASYAWDLGNGATRAGPGLAYSYPLAGTYTLTLTVTDNAGASGQSQFGPFAVQKPSAGLVVDAGDSSYVAIGQPITLTAQAFGNQGAVSFAWDTDGDHLADRAGQSIQVSSAGRPAGGNAFQAFATDAGTGQSGTDSVQVFLYNPQVAAQPFTAFVAAGLVDEQVGRSGQVDQSTFRYDVTVPPGTQQLEGTLTWGTFVQVAPDGNPSGVEGGPNDFDLYAFSPGGAQNTQSAGFKPPEHILVPGPTDGLWTFEVRPFTVVADTFTLWVNQTQAPPDPVPAADQESQVCFSTPTQQLRASAPTASGSSVTGAWDVDADGIFETAGMTAQTSFAVGSGAHLVRFRATSSDGYRSTILVAERVQDPCPSTPSVVVVGVADTGINPYADQFAGELVPYPELKAFTTVDPAAPETGDVPVYHHVNGQLLPFTRHPSDYIPGFPQDAPALKLTLGGGFWKSLDDAAVWSRGHEVVLQKEWMWIPGTKIVAAIDATDNAAENGAADPTPLFDDHGHGTASAAVSVGNTVGTCPRCVLAFIEGLNDPQYGYVEPWIDFLSISGSPQANVDTPDLGGGAEHDPGRLAAERGQTISFAAGNGVLNAFDVTEQTYLPRSNGPDWVLRVGAVGTGGNRVILGTGKPVDWSSFGLGNIPASCRNSYAAVCQHSGTSSATPTATGVMGAALLNARIALGDAHAGQLDPGAVGGKLQAIAAGPAIPASPWLADGVLTRAELWNVTMHCASGFGGPGSVGFPDIAPASPVDFLYGGYGLADRAAAACASLALLTGSGTHSALPMDAFLVVDSAIRTQLFGAWDGDGDGEPGGNFNGQTLPLATTVGPDDVDTADEASVLLRDLFAQAWSSPLRVASLPVTETYYLHRPQCVDGADPMTMDHAPALAREAGHGCAGATANMDNTWTATVTTAQDFVAGSTVNAVVRAFSIVPEANVVMHGTLLADGVAVGSGDSDPVTIVSLAKVSTPCTTWAISFPTTVAIPAGTTLQLNAAT
ncbi:MAG: PKD domain-containing protein, partial [Halobacteriales archaeon]|nr:PKD domain-containing protein [Halobacteriales archaeon]